MVFHHAQHRISQGNKYNKSCSQIVRTKEWTVDSIVIPTHTILSIHKIRVLQSTHNTVRLPFSCTGCLILLTFLWTLTVFLLFVGHCSSRSIHVDKQFETLHCRSLRSFACVVATTCYDAKNATSSLCNFIGQTSLVLCQPHWNRHVNSCDL